MWQRSGLAARWARASAAGGPSGAVADRDLDAVVALFDAAAGLRRPAPVGRRPGLRRPPLRPGAARRHRRRPRGGGGDGPAAHRARRPRAWSGTSSASPACRRACGPTSASAPRCSAPRSSSSGSPASTAPRVDRRTLALAEERRLFYVACTRARRRLLVTAVEGALDGADAGATASRFLDLVAPPPEDGRPLTELPRSLTLPALVADLRRALTDPQTPPDRRSAAASVLRRLADEGVPGAAPVELVGPGAAVGRRPAGARGRCRCGCARRRSRPSSAAR